MKFRRSPGSTVWHWRRPCPSWPSETDAEEQTALPRDGALCKDCEALDLTSALQRLKAEEEARAAAETAEENSAPRTGTARRRASG